MRIGVLTGGGDCPGLNAVIRAVARRSWSNGNEVVGVREGWRGMVEHLFEPLGPNEISGILPRGGTIVGTSRTNPYKVDGGVEQVRKGFEQLDALVAIGGEKGGDEAGSRAGSGAGVRGPGHARGGGPPPARDRPRPPRFGLRAAALAQRGQSGQRGGRRGDDVISGSLEGATAGLKGVPAE